MLCGVISSYLTAIIRARELRQPARQNRADAGSTPSTSGAASTRRSPRCAAGRRGLLVHREHIFEGIESCVDALNGLFTGANIGKTLVRLGGS